MKKRALSVLLLLALLPSILPVRTLAAEEEYGSIPIYLGDATVDYMAEELLKQIPTQGKSSREQIRAVYDWIIRNCAREGDQDTTYFDKDEIYAQAEANLSTLREQVSQGEIAVRQQFQEEMVYDQLWGMYVVSYDSNEYIANFAYEMMMYRVGNCAHYSALLALLLGHLGFDCRLIPGEFINRGGSQVEHKWNYVLVDGQYYWLDVRMDQAFSSGSKTSYTFFMVSDTAEWATRHSWDHEYSDWLAANAGEIAESYVPKVTYLYDEPDPGADVKLDAARLNQVTDQSSAVSAVRSQVQSMTTAQKESATGADLATLYAETATFKAASKQAETGNSIVINAAAVSDLETIAEQTNAAVEEALTSGGVTTARYLSNTVTLTTDTTDLAVQIDPDILGTNVDKVRVETPTYAVTFPLDALKDILTETLTYEVEDEEASGTRPAGLRTTDARPLALTGAPTVNIKMPAGKRAVPITVSMPKGNGSTAYQAVVNDSGKAISSKLNPATDSIDGRVNTSGTYTVRANEKNFTDISNKSAEMQSAIRYLASKGIFTGMTPTSFAPDGTINRAEVATMILRALGKLDSSASNSFTDVKKDDWYYSAAGSSQTYGIINGYEDKTFRGKTAIPKNQIVAIAARTLKNEMGYKNPGSTSSYLGPTPQPGKP